MPITRKQFELEIDPKIEDWMKKIHSFLAEHKDEAFTKEELRQHHSLTLLRGLSEQQKRLLQVSKGSDPFYVLSDERTAFDGALEKLVELRSVAQATIRNSTYYAYRRELPEVL